MNFVQIVPINSICLPGAVSLIIMERDVRKLCYLEELGCTARIHPFGLSSLPFSWQCMLFRINILQLNKMSKLLNCTNLWKTDKRLKLTRHLNLRIIRIVWPLTRIGKKLTSLPVPLRPINIPGNFWHRQHKSRRQLKVQMIQGVFMWEYRVNLPGISWVWIVEIFSDWSYGYLK